MSIVLDEAEAVLHDVGSPLHYKDLASRMVSRGRWSVNGSTPPEQVLNSFLSGDIQRNGDRSRFIRLGRAIYGLKNGGASDSGDAIGESPSDDTESSRRLSFVDAAERVLDKSIDQQPVHYRDLAHRILMAYDVTTRARTPEASLYTQIVYDIDRTRSRGEIPRFVRYHGGMFGLSKWEMHGLEFELSKHNDRIRSELKARLMTMSPEDFQLLIGRLLVKLGFSDVNVSPMGRDGGIDVRGTLLVADVIRTNMAIQVKRWKSNVQAPIVSNVRGSLGVHDQGLIITTSDFSKGARDHASIPNAIPVALMNGDQLVQLLVVNGLGVRRKDLHLLEPASIYPDDE